MALKSSFFKHLPLNLDRLYASKNDLQNLSDISNLCNITEIDLSSNDLKYIEPGDLTCMGHLISGMYLDVAVSFFYICLRQIEILMKSHFHITGSGTSMKTSFEI